MREHYPDADIEQEYSVEKAVQRLRKKRNQDAVYALNNYPYKETGVNPTAAVESLKQPCQPVEQNGMTVYAPIIEF